MRKFNLIVLGGGKSQDRHKISFAIEFINKTPKKSSGQICPLPIQLSWIYHPIQLGLSSHSDPKFPITLIVNHLLRLIQQFPVLIFFFTNIHADIFLCILQVESEQKYLLDHTL